MSKFSNKAYTAAVLRNEGWQEDRWGHFRREGQLSPHGPKELFRVKLMARSAKLEVQRKIVGKNEWFAIGSAYYKDLHFWPAGRLSLTDVVYTGVDPCPYADRGYESRAAYLKDLAYENEVELDVVLAVADLLGPNEDFDGLVTSLEDYR